ncbi:hypothetical protein BvCmsKSP054_05228 [Escherichia coli]|nr:hypothetical protein BvCmsKSP054_05228 [Escherichia coli]
MINGIETQNIVLHLCGRADKGFIKTVDRSPSCQHPVKVAETSQCAGNTALKTVKIRRYRADTATDTGKRTLHTGADKLCLLTGTAGCISNTTQPRPADAGERSQLL